jgi:CheY-like chemotaxis protein
VVEDEFMIRIDMAAELRDAGYLVLEAANAIEGIALLDARTDIRIIVTDISMPGDFDGNELIRRSRAMYPWIRIIAATGSLSHEPVDAILRKPYHPERAMALIERLLEGTDD